MKQVYIALIFSVTILVSAWMLAGAWARSHQQNETIRVTGMAKKDFTADLIVWRGNFSKKSMTIQEAYAVLKKDAALTKDYLIKKGVKAGEIVFSAVNISREYRYTGGSEGRGGQVFDGFSLSQSIEIESGEVDKIEKISREVTELIDLGVEFYSQYPEYYSTRLADLKIELLAQATADARNRAEQISGNSKAKLGSLRTATMGIFQITGQNSNEGFSWGGAYNTSSKKKSASITVKLEFGIK
jgi:uncharacterized protein